MSPFDDGVEDAEVRRALQIIIFEGKDLSMCPLSPTVPMIDCRLSLDAMTNLVFCDESVLIAAKCAFLFSGFCFVLFCSLEFVLFECFLCSSYV